MKAIVYRRYGSPDVLGFEEVDEPLPGDDQVLIKVRAASVNPIDWHFMRGMPVFIRMMTGLRGPKNPRLGVDVAGQVEAVGKNVTDLKAGDEVFGPCRGAFAEYACASRKALVAKPKNVSFGQAAAVPVAGGTASQGLSKGRIQAGQRVLINGAAGGVGTFAVQIAKAFGAEVTGVCSARNVEMVRSIGADHVIDYTKDDFTAATQQHDVIFDCMGNHSLSAIRRVLKPKGTYIMVGGPMPHAFKALASSPFASQRIVPFLAKENQEDLTSLRHLMEAGKLTSVIDRRYALSEVAEAIRYLEAGHARGKVVITVSCE